jgi:uroporphyrinogen-III decarboxylase
MTSRERFFKVFQGELPDRMPVTLHMFDHARFVTKVYPEVDPLDYSTINLKSIELSKQLGADVFVRMLYDANDPIHIFMGGLVTDECTDSWQVSTEEIQEGSTLILRSTIRTPEGELSQDYSINRLPDGQEMHACTKKPIQDPKDLDLAMKFEPPMNEDKFRKGLMPKVRKLKNALGEDGVLGIWVPSGPFNQASLIYNLTDLYTLYITDFPFYERLMTFSMERILGYTKVMKEANPDVLIVGGNVPSGFVGPQVYDEYILPFEKKYIDYCQAGGIPAMYHNCGQIMSLLESYKKLGVRIVEPFTPPPGGDADLTKAKEIVGRQYVMVGGVDKLELLLHGTVDQVKREVARIVNIVKPGGNHILQNADSLEYNTPVENVRAYIQTAVENSWY